MNLVELPEKATCEGVANGREEVEVTEHIGGGMLACRNGVRLSVAGVVTSQSLKMRSRKKVLPPSTTATAPSSCGGARLAANVSQQSSNDSMPAESTASVAKSTQRGKDTDRWSTDTVGAPSLDARIEP